MEDTSLADLIVRNGNIVTMDAERRVFPGGLLAVTGNRITYCGPDTPMRGRSEIDAAGAIVLPGLIDTHVHTAQQFLRGRLAMLSRRRPPKYPVWKHYYLPYEAMLTEEDVHLSAQAAYANMITVGTTCFADAGGPHPDAMARAADEVGIRGFVALSTMDTGQAPPGMVRPTAEAHDMNVALVRRWADHPRVRAFLSLRQILTCTPELIQAIGGAARALGTRIHTHLAEGIYEVDHTLEVHGCRPAEYLDRLGVFDAHLHCAHSVILSPEEVDLYAARGPSACHCGFHNYQLGVPRLAEMHRRGIRVGLGTDGAASSATLDLFQSAHVARIGQQAVVGTPWNIRAPISAETLLWMASHGGAKALGIGADTGFLAAGAKADLLICDASQLDQFGITDALFTAATTLVGRDVRSVIVDGRLVMKDRELLTIDTDRLRHDLRRRVPGIIERFEASSAPA